MSGMDDWQERENQRMREHVPGEDTVSRLSREITRLRAGIQDYLDGNYDNPRKHRINGPQTKCRHGLYYWDACACCIDDHFARLLHPAGLNRTPPK